MADLRTRRGVEIARVGEWNTTTGKWRCTRSQLEAAVRAQHDPAFRPGVLKLGHRDPRFNQVPGAHGLPMPRDGEPALGRLVNLRLEGDSLLGDVEGVPPWLDDIWETAYPSRSVEAGLGVEAPSGNRYDMVVRALALLGVTAPAIESLDDLRAGFGVAAGAGELVAAVEIAAAIGDAEPAPEAAAPDDPAPDTTSGDGALPSERGRARQEPKEQRTVDTAALRERLAAKGIAVAEDATDEDILAAIDALPTQQESQPTTTTSTGAPSTASDGGTDTQHDKAPAVADVQALVAAAVREATAPLRATITDLGTQLAERKATEAAETRARVLDEAVRLGKIKPADRPSWENRYDQHPAVTTDILDALPVGVEVPVAAAGYAGGEAPGGDELDAEWRQVAAVLGLPVGGDA